MWILKKDITLEKLFIIMIVSLNYFRFYNFIPKLFVIFYMFIIILLFIYLLFKKKFSKKGFLSIILLSIIGVFCLYINKNDMFFFFIICSISIIDMDNDEFIKYFFYASLVMFILTIILNIFGILPSYNINKYDGEIIYKRYSLGFGHVNSVFLYYLPILFGFYHIFVKDKKSKLIHFIIQFVIIYILYKVTLCRTGFLISILFLSYTLFNNKCYCNKHIKYTFLFFTIISLLVAVIYGFNQSNFVNSLLSNRAYLVNYYIKNNLIINLFGNRFDLVYTLDNLYAFILVKYGIIIYIIYMFIYFYSIKKIEDNDRYLIYIFFFLLYGLSEGNMCTNFMLILQLKELFFKGQVGDTNG